VHVNETDLDWNKYDHEGATFCRKELSTAADTNELGCSLYELPPGARSWPYHYHTANEEALYVLAGDGRLRAPDGAQSLTAGDFVSFPADERGAHRVVNDADEPLRYLMLSTMREPDLTVYPDSGTMGIFVGAPPGERDERNLHGFYDLEDDLAFWESVADAAEDSYAANRPRQLANSRFMTARRKSVVGLLSR